MEPMREPSIPPGWVLLASADDRRPPASASRRRVFAWLVAVSLVVVSVVAVLGITAARQLAESEAVSDDAKTTELVAAALVSPALLDGLQRSDPDAIAVIDEVVRDHVLSTSIVRVKIWARDGTILYSDEPRLIGQQFELGEDELEAFADDAVHAEVTDLDEPENVYEEDGGKLLEAYRQLSLPDGSPVLFESYFQYDDVDSRAAQIWSGFAAIMLGSLLLLVILLIPVIWRLLRELGAQQRQREALLSRSLDASESERRRIAGQLHDGVVQDFAATAFSLAGLAERAATIDGPLAADIRATAATVRGGIGGLRSLLVDIYPPSLAVEGLVPALNDLASALRARGVAVAISVQEGVQLAPETERLIYRIAHECLTNVLKHASADSVALRVRESAGRVTLSVSDDGVGFDATKGLAASGEGHFGLRVMRDVAVDGGARLALRSAPGAGTEWLLTTGRT
jgi:two-component system NarL family sensor kinase